MTVQARYPLAPLLALTGWSVAGEIRDLAPCGGQEYRRRLTEGVTEAIADRLATAAHLHPFEVWPEMAEHVMAAAEVECPGCGVRHVPTGPQQRYCSPRCRRAASMRRQRRNNPGLAERQRELRRRYYAENRRYEINQAAVRRRQTQESTRP